VGGIVSAGDRHSGRDSVAQIHGDEIKSHGRGQLSLFLLRKFDFSGCNAEFPIQGSLDGRIWIWGSGCGAMIAAAPTKEGRYAMARQQGNRILISMTEDGGKARLSPVVAADLPQYAGFLRRPIKYSPKGDLGLIWKAIYPDGSFIVWSAASRNRRRTFKTVRISHTISPPCDLLRCNFMLEDDLSSMDIDGQYGYAVWGDNRSGFEGTWFGRVPSAPIDMLI
jgi:hypothetical protein